jgi:hypothetical protein
VFRILYHLAVGTLVIGISLFIGILGYHFLEGFSWLDALLNASMILGGMGPVDVIHTNAGKIFASIYALFAGVVFLVVAGLIIAPAGHRIMHRLHMDEDSPAKD